MNFKKGTKISQDKIEVENQKSVKLLKTPLGPKASM